MKLTNSPESIVRSTPRRTWLGAMSLAPEDLVDALDLEAHDATRRSKPVLAAVRKQRSSTKPTRPMSKIAPTTAGRRLRCTRSRRSSRSQSFPRASQTATMTIHAVPIDNACR